MIAVLVQRSRWVLYFAFQIVLLIFSCGTWQLNANTHFLDLSLVYGSDDASAVELRTNKSGKMNVTSREGDLDLLPPTGNNSPLNAPCTLPKEVSGIDPPSDVKCFKAGK